MAGVRLSKAQARRLLGVELDAATHVPATPAPPPPAVDRRRRPRQRYASTCHDCGEHFDTQAAETRHMTRTGHARYQLELDL